MRALIPLLLALGFLLGDLAAPAALAVRPEAAHHRPRGFRNLSPDYSYSALHRIGRLVHGARHPAGQRGPGLAVVPNDGAHLRANGVRPTLTWVGHSTFLIQLDGVNVLTDPHWGPRASPVGFAGPRRLIPPGIAFEALPPVHAVVISHDHYDHLDAGTVRRLADRHAPRFFVPLGVGSWLAGHEITDVVELDWWQAADFRGLTFTATPAQHSSGRGLHDQNRRLWAGWAITGGDRRLFFAGDTGYWPGLGEIGRRLGPFHVALLPIGGYYPGGDRHPNHLDPEEAVQVLADVGGGTLVPMHWGTFDMNREPLGEPPDRLRAEARRRGVADRLAVLAPGQILAW